MSNSSISVDDQIYSCLNLEKPTSFFLFAGAGSGKTRSLVEVLKKFKKENIHHLKISGQKVAIITYTNAASDEIKRRLEFDSNFAVSTIHSFSWELIRPFQRDIKGWIRSDTQNVISDLEEKQRKGRLGTKAASDRASKIESKKKRLETLDKIKSFTYNPNGTNSSRDSLNHAEVIKIASVFLSNKPLMQQILIKKYPILLIDESQDTKKELIEAFFTIQTIHQDKFVLGLFGDTMQRIYTDGKLDLGTNIPDSWETPKKVINYRCPRRVITLINKIRSDVDGQIQEPASTNIEGVVRIFIVDSNIELDKQAIEKQISEQMSEFTNDDSWKNLHSAVKTLTLEHHMAARRSGFIDFFEPLYKSTSDSTGLLDGSMTGIPFFIREVLPLIKAKQLGDEFAVAQIMKKYSPLLDKNFLKGCDSPIEQIKNANTALETLLMLWNNKSEPSLLDILRKIRELNIFTLPDQFAMIVDRSDKTFEDNSKNDNDKSIDAWEGALNCQFTQLEKYADYISDNSAFGTHQGIKGLEFPRVMVILDDAEARGFLFSYEKLFGAKSRTTTDIKNESEGKETGIDRTRRFFYVTCSRAEKSLAIVAYTKNPDAVKHFAIHQDWFENNEVIMESENE
ncbi:UvrD-helicase domain-containing protein [Desulfobacula sp.]|uniref:UvrD-helicase domain-containing protein n=1 Tax=Desulfobacula sp. TaxID=2593537 RepID=UPI00260F816C|nr:UvrD-helicase domain-containing protein [Desulfobacula sp.]